MNDKVLTKLEEIHLKLVKNSRVLTKFEEIHLNLAILPLHFESRALGPQRASALIFAFNGSNENWIYIDNWVSIKLEEIHRNVAILPLHWESRAQVLSEQVGDKGLIVAF